MPKIGQNLIPLTGAGDDAAPEVARQTPLSSDQAGRTALSNSVSRSSSVAPGPLPPKGSKPLPPPKPKPNPFAGLPRALGPNADKASIIEEAQADLLLSQYDELNKLWDKAEKQLTSFHVPHEVQVTGHSWPYGDDDLIEGHKADCIVWTKRDNVWRVCWGESVSPVDDNAYRQVRPISDCAIDDRVKAAKYLPELIEAIRKARNNYIPKVADACEQIRSALKSMRLE